MAISANQFLTVDGFSNGFLTHKMQIFYVKMFSHFILCLFRFFGWGGEDDNFFQRLADKVFEKFIFLRGSLAELGPYGKHLNIANI